jgi:hypothetical protein
MNLYFCIGTLKSQKVVQVVQTVKVVEVATTKEIITKAPQLNTLRSHFVDSTGQAKGRKHEKEIIVLIIL